MFPTRDTIDRVLDGVDLAIDFATLGEYGLITEPSLATADERLLRATGALPPARVVQLRPPTAAAPAPVPVVRRLAPATAAGARLALSPVREARPVAPVHGTARPAADPCPGEERRHAGRPAGERASEVRHGGRRRGGAKDAPAARDQLSLDLSA